GLVTRAQLVALGYRTGQIERMVSGGRLERIARAVYRIPGSVPTSRQRLLAEVWAAGHGAVATDRAAAALWRIPRFSDGPLDVLRGWRGSRSRRGSSLALHETCLLPAHHVADVDGIPVTSPELTLLRLCGIVHPKRAERAVNNAINMRLTTPAR